MKTPSIERLMNNVVDLLDKTNGRTPMHKLSAKEAEARVEFFETSARLVAKAGVPAHIKAASTADLEGMLLRLGGDRWVSVVEVALELAAREYAAEVGGASDDRRSDVDEQEVEGGR